VFKQLADMKHDIRNPVRREAHFPVDPQLIDLKGSRGYEAVAEGGVGAMLHEYRHHASYSSYLYDYLAALEQLIAGISDNDQRQSFCVVLTGLREVQRRITNRLDFLKIYGEKRNVEPGLVSAVEQAIVGTADLPVSSADVLEAVSSYRAQAQKIAIKQGAVHDLPPPGKGAAEAVANQAGRVDISSSPLLLAGTHIHCALEGSSSNSSNNSSSSNWRPSGECGGNLLASWTVGLSWVLIQSLCMHCAMVWYLSSLTPLLLMIMVKRG
jgi:hypothetical protein